MTEDYSDVRVDGVIENAATGMGDPNFDKSMGYQVVRNNRLSKQTLEDLYEGAWIPQVCVTAYPKESVRKWLEIKMGGKTSDRTMIANHEKYQQRIGVKAAMAKADTWARLYGGAAIVIIAEDGQPCDKPLKASSLKSIRGLKVLDRHRIRPVLEYSLMIEDPEFYELIMPGQLDQKFKKALGQEGNTGTKVHKSRVIRFDGVEMPPDIMMRNEGWGISILNLLFDTFTRFEGTDASIATLVQEASLFIYKMKNLSEMLERSDEKSLAQLRTRLAAFRSSKSNFKMLIADADKETVEIVTRNFAGLPELMDKQLIRIVGAARIPLSVLFGQGPTGLAAQGAGDNEAKTWAQLVQQHQISAYQDKLRSHDSSGLFDLIWLAQDGPSKGKPPEDWSMEWRSLIEETEEERIAKRSAQSTVDQAYFNMRAVLPEEIRVSRFGGAEYSTETVLDDKAWKKSQEDPFAGLSGEGEDPNADPYAGEEAEQGDPFAGLSEEEEPARTDSSDRPMEIRAYQGLSLGITHRPGDLRHGRPMSCAYGHIRGSYGQAEDGMAHDVYIAGFDTGTESDRLFRVRQLKNDGSIDESKWMLGCQSITEARDLYLQHMPRLLFGGVEESSWGELEAYRQDCACEENENDKKTKSRKRKRIKGRPLEDVEDELDRESAGVNASTRKDAATPDAVDLLLGKATASGSEAVVGWVDQIYDWLEAGRADGLSLEEVADRLPVLYGKLSPDKLTQSLEDGLKMGNLIGRGEVLEEIKES